MNTMRGQILKQKKELVGTVIMVVVFVASAILSQTFDENLRGFMEGYNLYGQLFYFFITVLATVLAPLNALFLLPVAVNLWGAPLAAIISLSGWTLGAVIAFLIAKKFMHPLLVHVPSIRKFERIAEKVPEQRMFWWMVFARMTVPVDILSYAIGLFLPVRLMPYTLATIVGGAPFALIFSYASDASLAIMIAAGGLALLAVTIGTYWFNKTLR